MDPRFKGRLGVGVAEAWDRLEKAVIDNATAAAQVFYCMFARGCTNCSLIEFLFLLMHFDHAHVTVFVKYCCYMGNLFVSTASNRGPSE